MAASATTADYQLVSTAVDQAFYRAVYRELDRPGVDPVRHYLEQGWREGRDPAPWFSVRRYLRRHPDIVRSGVEPLTHYLRHGSREGREIFPSDHAALVRSAIAGAAWSYQPQPPGFKVEAPPEPETEPQDEPLYSEWDRALAAREFDSDFYAESNSDVVRAGADLLEHFLAHGWREGRDPAPWFSVREYLLDNPDVADAGVNPFAHYIAQGRAENRAPRTQLGFRHRIIVAQVPLEARVAEIVVRSRRSRATPAKALAGAVARSRTGLKDVHITFSHDDFARHVGGVQLCLQHESARVAAAGRDHLHVFAAAAWPVLRIERSALLGVTLNGQPVGAFSAATLAEALKAMDAGSARGSFAIHNLLGHQVDEVVAIVEAAGLGAGFIWLHDFTSLCAGYQLLRNDVEDCSAPPLDSPACEICLYGPARVAQIAEHERLFRALRLTVASPSQTTLDFWRSRSDFPSAGEVVHPHMRLVRRRRAPRGEPGPLRVAFLGMPATHKGWPIFAELAERHAEDPRYRFFHLGARRDPRTAMEHQPVSVSLDNPHAMQAAIERLEIDVAVIWSIFRETFCLAAYEAVAAGAAVVTGPDSANVAAFVRKTGAGRVLPDEAALARAFDHGELLGLGRAARRPWLYDIKVSGMTADLIDAGAAP
jgi:hypothetical protein